MVEATSADFSTEIPGGRLARIQMTPSSSWGKNSDPIPVPSHTAPATTPTATPTVIRGWRTVRATSSA